MKISIIGTGYVGLVTGVCLSMKGHQVTCYDKDKNVVDSLNKCEPTFYEKGLKRNLSAAVSNQSFCTKIISDNPNFDSDIIMITVGTPFSNGQIDLTYVKEVAKIIGIYLKSSDQFVSVVIKSTVIPGTTDTIVRKILEKYSGKKIGDFGLGMNPEFLREGNAFEDAMELDRVVLGYEDHKTLKILRELYEPWKTDKIEVNTRTAEMIKYANNSLLATQISAVNEIANITQEIGNIDVMEVMNGVFTDKRWSPILEDGSRVYPDILKYLIPGCGFGGSCFPKDIMALKALAEKLGLEPRMLNSILETNQRQPYQVVQLLKKTLPILEGMKILLLGLAFKPDTDDIRDSVSINVIKYLLHENAVLFAHDPEAMANMQSIFKPSKNLNYISDWAIEIDNIDAIIILTDWVEYKKIAKMPTINLLDDKIIFDTKRLLDPKDFPKSKYLTIGRSINSTQS